MYHYAYRITNIVSKYHYSGSRSCSILPVDDIGYHYFSSSTNKFWIQDQKDNPQDYKYKIVYTSTIGRTYANKFEEKYHNRIDVMHHKQFINRTNANVNGFTTLGMKHSKETKRKISVASLGKVISEEQKIKTFISKSKIESNGLSIAQNASIKGASTSKNTIQNNGKTIEENSQIKRVATMKHNKTNVGVNNSMARSVVITDNEGVFVANLLTLDLYKWCAENKVSRTYVIKVLDKKHKHLYETIPHQRYYNSNFRGFTFEYL